MGGGVSIRQVLGLTSYLTEVEYTAFRYGILIHGEPLEVLRNTRSNAFDVVFTDPPYGVTGKWWDDPEKFFELEPELYRVTRPHAWLAFWWSVKLLPNAFKLKHFKYKWQIIAIHKSYYQQHGVLGRRLYSPILVFAKGKPKINKREDDIVYAGELPTLYKLPIEVSKSTLVNAHVLRILAKPGNLVLDPFAGSGTIPLVCEAMGLHWVGIESSEPLYWEAISLLKEVDKHAAVDAQEHR